MPDKKKGFDLPVVDDLFGTEPDNHIVDPDNMVQEIPLAKIEGFTGHPFKVRDDAEMLALVDSVKEDGVLAPVLVRELDGKYQLVSGHRRRRAAELAGLTTIPAIVREMTDDEATIAMVDSNLQRERILPSEKAWAYRLKLEAIKHQGRALPDSMSESADIVGIAAGESGRTVQRYVRLTYLIPELLQLVDEGKVKMGLADDYSRLPEDVQREYYNEHINPTPQPPKPKALKLNYERVARFFHESYSKEDIAETIERALEAWFADGEGPTS